MIGFEAPAFLLALLLVPLSIAAYAAADARRRRAAAAFASGPTMPSVAPAGPGWRRHAPLAVYALALTLLALALARPQATVAVPDERATVMLAIDDSGSMAASDVAPTRLAAARATAREFVDGLPRGVRIGVVAFDDRVGAIAVPQRRRGDARRALARLEPGGGTATGDALVTALRSIRSGRQLRGRGPAAIVLLSDGVSTHGADPVVVARQARRRGIAVHTVALGSSSGRIEVRTRRGLESRPVPAPDRATLRRVARLSGGEAYAAADEVELEEIYDRLRDSVGTRTERREVTAGFAGVAALLLAVGGLLSLRWFGRAP